MPTLRPGRYPCTQTTPFVLDTDAKSRQQSNRLRITSSSLPQPLRGGLHSDACHAPCVIADDLHAVALRDHQDLRRTGSSRLTGVSSEPLGLLHGTTLEALHHVVVGQQRRRQVSVGHPVAKGEARFISLRSPGRSRAWRLPGGDAFAPHRMDDTVLGARAAARERDGAVGGGGRTAGRERALRHRAGAVRASAQDRACACRAAGGGAGGRVRQADPGRAGDPGGGARQP